MRIGVASVHRAPYVAFLLIVLCIVGARIACLLIVLCASRVPAPHAPQANLRFAINFFTSIGLGGLTDKMREHYKEMPRIMAEQQVGGGGGKGNIAG